MEPWAAELDSWDVCDTLCNNLFRKAAPAWTKAAEWPGRAEEFVKRAGFVLGATLAVHDKAADDARFLPLLALAERECTDERNFVKKAVNWQIRQIGKRSAALNAEAIATCERILAAHPDIHGRALDRARRPARAAGATPCAPGSASSGRAPRRTARGSRRHPSCSVPASRKPAKNRTAASISAR